MKGKIFVILQSVFLALGLLAVTVPVNPAAPGKSGKPSPAVVALGITPTVKNPLIKSRPQEKPLAVWECTTSWYGDDFDGLPTANGETYDMYADTGAPPTLPLG